MIRNTYNLQKLLTILAISTTMLCQTALASEIQPSKLYNFGYLDVKALNNNKPSNEWYIEYLKPGDQIQKQLQISNFSKVEKNLLIYTADTSINENKTFIAKNNFEKSDDIANWITLPAKEITLKAGESKILSVNFSAPKNAGVGLHTGAVLVKENPFGNLTKSTENQTVSFEKGVRVYLNVTGPVINNTEIKSIHIQAKPGETSLNFQVKNTGTTDYKQETTFSLKNIFSSEYFSTIGILKVHPSEEKITSVSVPTSGFGFYEIIVEQNNQAVSLGYTFMIPWWIIAGYFAFILIKKDRKILEMRKIQLAEFQKSFAFLSLFALLTTITFGLQYSFITAKAEEAGLTIQHYNLNLNWGNLKKIALPANRTQKWEGEITVNNGSFKLNDLKGFERKDRVELKDNNQVLEFNLENTANDLDEALLSFEGDSQNPPIFTYKNSLTNEEYKYSIEQILRNSEVITSGAFQLKLRAEKLPEPEENLRGSALETAPIENLNATPDINLEASPDNTIEIPELKNLFIEELPATPEVLAEYILNSDYVENVSTERKTSQIESETILIKALEATPDVLQEILATPDLNFVFVPSETITFPPQDYSAEEKQVSSQDLGTLIFVQNQDSPWNTYVGTSEFISLSNAKNKLPASAFRIIPGDPQVLSGENGSEVEAGIEKNFKNTSDKALLLSVTPENNDTNIIVLKPKAEIQIPAGTRPGVYRGQITITSL